MRGLLPQKGFSPYSFIFAAAITYICIKNYQIVSQILISMILVVMLSLALNPVVTKLRHWAGNRTLATILIVLSFLIVMGGVGFAFYHPVKRSLGTFIERMPQYWERIQKPMIRMQQKAVRTEAKINREVSNEVAQAESPTGIKVPPHVPLVPEDLMRIEPASPSPQASPAQAAPVVSSSPPPKSGVFQLGGGITSGFMKVASNAASIAMIAVTVFVGVVYTLLNPKKVYSNVFALVPAKHHDPAMRIFKRIAEFIPRWAGATLIGMGLIGGMVFVAMLPLFSLQDALVLGLIAMVFEAVPYIGPLLSVVPALLLGIAEGGMTTVWVVVAYLIVQFLENNVIYPMVVGSRLSVNPVTVIFAILVCVALFGVLGVILAVPLAVVTRIFHEELYRPRHLPNLTNEDLDRLASEALSAGSKSKR